MKKDVMLFSILFLILIIGVSGINAQEEEVNNAYTCLNEKISSIGCNDLSTDEKVFSFLATGQCKNELINEANTNGCFKDRGGQCNVELTAKAGFALSKFEEDTSLQEEWLLNQKGVSKDLIWYLEIDGDQAMNCEITSVGTTSTIQIGGDKKISGNAGICLNPTQSNYWLEINKNCYEEKFEIKCDEGFKTTLLFREENSPTIHVSRETHESSGAPLSEKINSLCFEGVSGNCDYSGSLWASLFLDLIEKGSAKDVEPYLTTGTENNPEDFPSVFLYILTNNMGYQADILMHRQTQDGYFWNEGMNRYYSTALALLPFIPQQDLFFKDNAKNWLLSPEIQGPDGCWDGGNIVNNAFLLYSLWPEAHPLPPVSACEEADYSCLTDSPACEDNGGIEVDLSCENAEGDFCCDMFPPPSTLCVDQEGNFSCQPLGEGIQCDGIEEFDCDSGEFCCYTEPPSNSCDAQGEGYECLTVGGGETCGDIQSEFDCSTNEYCCYTTPAVEVDTCLAAGEGYSCCGPGEDCEGVVNSSLNCVGDAWCFYKEPNPCLDIGENYTCVPSESLCNDGEGGIVNSLSCTGEDFCCYEGWTDEEKFCEAEGFECLANQSLCGEGTILDEFTCLGSTVCCGTESPPVDDETCDSSIYEGYSCILEGTYCEGATTNLLECASGEECCQEEIIAPGNECVDAGNECVFNSACDTKSSEFCPGATVCCSEVAQEPTCSESNGDVCSKNEECKDGNELWTSDLSYGEICCIAGNCEEKTTGGEIPLEEDCIYKGGICDSSCSTGKTESSLYLCEDSGDVCCFSEEPTEGGSYWWVWVLFLLIIIVVVGILYRDKVKEIIQQIQSKMSKGGKKSEAPSRRGPLGMPAPYERRPQTTPVPRKIFPQSRPIQRKAPSVRKKSPAELDEVLKKLKDIGK